MSILDLQRRISEAGRIRIGQQVPTSGGRTRPEKLQTFRLTSADRQRIEQAAEVYGGTVADWQAPAGAQFEVITTRDSIDVIVPPTDLAFTQSYELWSAGGCQRRCDGVTESLSEGPCLCDPEKRECDIHTRLSVMLRDLPGLGVWRLDTSGYYAAVELSSAVEIIHLAAGRGALLPARLRLEQRSVKRPDAKGKPQTLRFAVPVLDIEITPAQLLSGGSQPLQLAQGASPLTPVPALDGPSWQPSIAEQSAAPAARAPRKNAAPEIPASGRSRATRVATEQPVQEPVPVDTAPVVEAPAPVSRPRSAQPAEIPPKRPRTQEGDPDYWPSRVHAAAKEHGIDHDGIRLIAAAVCSIDPGDLKAFTTKDLVEDEWQAIDQVVRSLPAEVKGPRACNIEDHDGEDSCADLDAISTWLWPRANAKGIDSWEAIDAVAVAATGKQPNDLGVVDWVAFTVGLSLGRYDAAAA